MLYFGDSSTFAEYGLYKSNILGHPASFLQLEMPSLGYEREGSGHHSSAWLSFGLVWGMRSQWLHKRAVCTVGDIFI